MSWAKINMQKKYKNYFVRAVFIVSFFAFSSNVHATVVTDNFNRANENPLANGWSTAAGFSSPYIFSSAYSCSSNTYYGSYWSANTFLADQFSSAKVLGTGNGGPAVRMATSGGIRKGYYVAVWGGQAQIRKINDTTSTQIGSDYSHTWSSSDIYSLSIRGNVLTLSINGIDQSPTVTDNEFSSGQPGLKSASFQGFDDWSGGSATPVYFSVGQNTTSHETGAGNVTVSGTTATFTVDQTATNMGVGDVINYDTDNKKCYISGKTSTTVWSCTNATGGTPTSATGVVVNSISHAFNSLSAAEAGAPTLLGNSDLTAIDVQLNFPCYYDSGADTTAVTINGYTTDATRYIKIYTPNDTTMEVNQSQRHNGNWDVNKYRLETVTGGQSLYIFQSYSVVDGLQITNSGTASTDRCIEAYSYRINMTIRNNILKGGYNGFYHTHGNETMGGYRVYNNIVYNSNQAGILLYNSNTVPSYVYNNTVYNSNIGNFTDRGGIIVSDIDNVVVNNISVENGFIDFGSGARSYNISSDTSAAGTGSLTNQTLNDIDFVSTTSGSEDLHIQNTSVARNIGADLSADVNLPFNTDIDGASRNATINNWDIGADETATQIYRSVGPSATGLLESDASHTRTVTLTSGAATFSVALADNIGVGDAVLIDTGGTDQAIDASDTLLFIHSRTSSTVYTLRTHTGSVPGNISVNDTYQIYRAYTSLSDAEAGTKNTSIPITFNGGNRDLVVNNEQWNIACYANGTTADTTAVEINSWNVSVQNFIKVYTPVSTSEVGATQRHGGKSGGVNYVISLPNSSYSSLAIEEDYVHIDGLEIKDMAANSSGIALGTANYAVISNNLIHDSRVGRSNPTYGISLGGSTYGKGSIVFNNIVYNINDSSCIHLQKFNLGTVYAYNNSVSNCLIGIGTGTSGGNVRIIKNNIAVNNATDYGGTWASGQDTNNISLDATSPNVTLQNKVVQFVDATNKDFHLAQSDTAARNAGANLTSEFTSYGLPVASDIDNQLRNPVGAGWDIGADEGTVEFTPTVMQTGGDYSTLSSWEAGVQTDLVASTTRVFAHGGITGTIADNASISGVTSGATATVVHATTNQILLESISGIFQSGEVVQVTAGNSVVISDNGNPASAVAKIDGAWTVADTTAVDIAGWETGADNYIKVYTTSAARHQGKWDTGKYRLVQPSNNDYSTGFINRESYLVIDGLQLDNSNGRYGSVLLSSFTATNSEVTISNNIVKGDIAKTGTGIYIGSGPRTNVLNNIVYNISGNGIFFAQNTSNKISYVYNNTIFNIRDFFGIGFYWDAVGTAVLKNNLVASAADPFYGPFHASSTNNATNINDTPTGSTGTNFVNQTFNFVSTTAGSEDFHLAETDTAARDLGTSLESDSALAFSSDIDGQTRLNHAWDIGADEVAEKIYRSVGPGTTAALATDNSHANTITITSGQATFNVALPDNVGVGDAVLIDTNNDNSITSADTLLFISGRNSSTIYKLQTHTGATPANISSNDTYQIFRAYTSLSNAEAGTKNTSIPITFNGGNRDLVTNFEQWNIACYGDAADTTAVTIDGWNTGAQNFIKVYTPVSTSEVGVTQRHNGKWDDGKYKISITTGLFPLRVRDNYIKIDGLQVDINYNVDGARGIYINTADVNDAVDISNNIIKASNSGTNNIGIDCIAPNVNLKIWNNIIYGFTNGSTGIYISDSHFVYVYNNSIINSSSGILRGGGDVMIKNNITQNCTNGYGTNFNVASDFNISDLAADAPGVNSKNSINVSFVDETNKDFHLASTDTAAKNAGINLNTDANLSFSTDIDGKDRPTGPTWDIGADEISDAESVRAKGDVKIKGDVKFK